MKRMDHNQYVEVSAHSNEYVPRNSPKIDEMHFSSNYPKDDNVKIGQGASIHDSLQPDAISKEITLFDLMNAVEKLSNRIESLEACNREMMNRFKGMSKGDAETPSPKFQGCNIHSSTGYSPDAEDNQNKMDKTASLAKEMKKLKNFGTINISDTEEERTKAQKRTVSKNNFVRNAPESKRQNTNLGKSPMDEDNSPNGVGEGVETSHKPFSSDYRRGFNAKEHIEASAATMTRRLTFTPSPGEGSKGKGVVAVSAHGKNRKTPKTTGAKRSSPVGRVKGPIAVGRTHAFRNNAGLTVPKNFRCAFKTTPDMKLDQEELRVCAYVFQEDFSSSDIIFKVGRNEYTRADFACMCPGMLVSAEIIMMMALKVSLTQHQSVVKTLWCLPPSFADAVGRGHTPAELHKFYAEDWMGRFDRLRLISVPIEDSRGHWYLMVISMDDRMIYQLDSHLRKEVIEERRSTIRNIATTLAKIVEVVYEGFISFTLLADFQYWDIVPAMGIPNCGNRDNSALWVVEWLNLQNSFTNIMAGVLDVDVTRMIVTMRLLMGNHNECNNDLFRKARSHWQLMTTPADKQC